MIGRCFARRQAVSAAVSAAVSTMPSRTKQQDDDPTDCIVCTAHTVCCMTWYGILALLSLEC